MDAVATPPASTKTSLTQRLSQHAHRRWPALAHVEVRFRAKFAHVNGQLPDGHSLPLCRLRYAESASIWGFAIYRDHLPGQPRRPPRQHPASLTISRGGDGTVTSTV